MSTPMPRVGTIFGCFCVVVLLQAFGFVSTVSAAPLAQITAPSLFSNSDTVATAQLTENAHIIRARSVAVNFGLLQQNKNEMRSSTLTQIITLNLFDDIQLLAQLEKVESLSSDSYAWVGHVVDAPYSEAIFIVNGQQATANIRTLTGYYQIRPTADGSHLLSEINEEAIDDGENDTLPSIGRQASSNVATAGVASDDGSVIDVLVLYTAATRNAAGGVTALTDLINLGMVETNMIFQNSGIQPRIRLVHAQEIDYQESGNFATDLWRLQSAEDSYLEQAHAIRDERGADLVSLWTGKDYGSCGMGYIWSEATTAFSVVYHDCATGYYSFMHEMGHNIGLRHDWYVDATIDTPTYNHGYVNVDGRWRTVMGYNTLCKDQGVKCTRIPYISTPDVLYSGAATGVPGGGETNCGEYRLNNPPCDADNRRVIHERAQIVANFRQSIPFLSAPTDLTVQPTTTSQIDLRWSDHASDEEGFTIERCMGQGCDQFVTLANVGANRTDSAAVIYQNRELNTTDTYCYRVQAFTQSLQSAYSNVACATPALAGQVLLVISQESNPGAPENFAFQGSLGDFWLDDPIVDDQDGYHNVITFTTTPGNYQITQAQRTGWSLINRQCEVSSGHDVGWQLTEGNGIQIDAPPGSFLVCSFDNQSSSSIEAWVFEDLNGNGKKNKKEPYLLDRSIHLYNLSAELIATSATISPGKAALVGLTPGSYYVCQSMPPAWQNTRPAQLTQPFALPCFSVTLSTGKLATVQFGNRKTTTNQDDDASTRVDWEPDATALPDVMYEDISGDTPGSAEENNSKSAGQRLFLPLIRE